MNKNKKKLLALLLSSVMVLSALPMYTFASETSEDTQEIVLAGIEPQSGTDLEANETTLADAFPDAAFRTHIAQSVLSNAEYDDDSDKDTALTAANITTIQTTTKLSMSNKGIASLSGIKYFSELTILDCQGNKLTELDVMGMTKLQTLNCSGDTYNRTIISLDVSGLTNLRTLQCNYNQLESLDLSELDNLKTLQCNYNNITELDESTLTTLTSLECNYNQLTSLDVSGMTSLTGLSCSANKISELDVSNLTNLKTLNCLNNKIEVLNVSNLTNLTSLICNNNKIEVLEVSNLTYLTVLNCYVNQISELDLSLLSKLVTVNIYFNPLNKLEFHDDAKSKITTLSYRNTNIGTMDLTGFTQLKILNVTKPVDANFATIKTFSVSGSKDIDYKSFIGFSGGVDGTYSFDATTGYYIITKPVNKLACNIYLPIADNPDSWTSTLMSLDEGGLFNDEGILIQGAKLEDVSTDGTIVLEDGGTIITAEATLIFEGEVSVKGNDITTRENFKLYQNQAPSSVGDKGKLTDVDMTDYVSAHINAIGSEITLEKEKLHQVIFDFSTKVDTQISPLFVTESSPEWVKIDDEVTMKVSYQNMDVKTDHVVLPFSFDNTAVEITDIKFNETTKDTYGLTPLYIGSENELTKHQNGTDDYTSINKDGKFLLTAQIGTENDTALYMDLSEGKPALDIFEITFKVIAEPADDVDYSLGFKGDNTLFVNGYGTPIVSRYYFAGGMDANNPIDLDIDFTNQPKVDYTELKITLPVEETTTVPEDTEVEITSVFTGNNDTVIDGGVTWTVTKGGVAVADITDVLTFDAADTDNLNPKFKTDLPGEYVVTVTSIEDPTLTDSRTIVVTVVKNISVKGYAKLSGKYRDDDTATDLNNVDKGIKIELIEKATDKVVGNTQYTTVLADGYNFDIPIDLENASDLKDYVLRFTRIGNNGERTESYLCAELEFDTTKLPTDTKFVIDIKDPIYLVAGAFDAPTSTKNKITTLDVNIIKALVGTSPEDNQQSSAFNIDERNGVDSTDLSIVRRFVGKTKADTGTVSYNDISEVWTLTTNN